jgi:hypothetical protein
MRNIDSRYKVRKPLIERLILRYIYRRIDKKFRDRMYITNSVTRKTQLIKPLKLYSDQYFVYSRGVPLYCRKCKKYNLNKTFSSLHHKIIEKKVVKHICKSK